MLGILGIGICFLVQAGPRSNERSASLNVSSSQIRARIDQAQHLTEIGHVNMIGPKGFGVVQEKGGWS